MNEKLVVWLLTTFFLATASLAGAQQSKKVPRIGYLGASSASSQKEVFRQALRDLGYIEGESTQVEYRYIEGQQDRVPNLVAELSVAVNE